MPRRADGALPLRHAAALGLLHGPAELLPISSSGHVELVPWLLGWPYGRLDAELRKSFEVALHAGTAAALLVALRGEVAEAVGGLDGRRVALIAGSLAPPVVAAVGLERVIEQRGSRPGAIAVGLVAGSVAMVAVERGRARHPFRPRAEAGLVDGLALGVAQACALWPGVSRNGATLVAARLRGFAPGDANVLSRHVALPVIAGAAVHRGRALTRRGLPASARGAFAAGTVAAFASTLAAARLVARGDRGGSLLPYAAYRTALAAVAIRRLRVTAASPRPRAIRRLRATAASPRPRAIRRLRQNRRR